MTTEDIIFHLFCIIDDELRDVKKHPDAHLYPSEVVTLGVLYALKGNGYRAFYRWLSANWRHLFPKLPEMSRLLRLLANESYLTRRFLEKPSFFTIMDSFGIELIHPIREGRSEKQIGRKGKSNHRWIVGMKYCLLINNDGAVVGWGWAPANEHDQIFRPIALKFKDETITLTDTGFVEKDALPSNIKLCKRGEWNDRMVIETIFSLVTTLFHAKKIRQRAEAYIEARLWYLTALINILLTITEGELSFTAFTL
jgi:hypothetical protein